MQFNNLHHILHKFILYQRMAPPVLYITLVYFLFVVTEGFVLCPAQVCYSCCCRRLRKGGPSPVFGVEDESAEGADLTSEFMEEVNQRENLLRQEFVRTLKQPSALLAPHTVLEHVLGSLGSSDFYTDDCGLDQAFLFSALDEEVSRGPVDYRRDWSDDDESQPRSLDRQSFAAVLRRGYAFLLGTSDYTIAFPPLFSEDDHKVTFRVRINVNATEAIGVDSQIDIGWVDMDFRLGRVREGRYKDCWLVERGILRGQGKSPPSTLWM